MSRTLIFLCTFAGAVVCATMQISPNAAPISFGMVVGAAGALFLHWAWNGFKD